MVSLLLTKKLELQFDFHVISTSLQGEIHQMPGCKRWSGWTRCVDKKRLEMTTTRCGRSPFDTPDGRQPGLTAPPATGTVGDRPELCHRN
jgi:hypothetical protein